MPALRFSLATTAAMQTTDKKSDLEFLQGRQFSRSVASAMRGRSGRFGSNSSRPGVPASLLRGARPLRVIVPLGTVVSPMQRLKIRYFVPSSFCFWPDVVDFPPQDGRGIPVSSPAHQFAANILTNDFGTVAGCDLSFPPYSGLGLQVKRPVSSIGIVDHSSWFCWFSRLACPAGSGAGRWIKAKLTRLNHSASPLRKTIARG